MMCSSALQGHLAHLSFHPSLYPKLVLRCSRLFHCLLVFQHETANLKPVPPPSGKDKNYINLTS